MAEAHRERAVAVVLSGTGSDGAYGLEHVKELGGVTMAQDPGESEHDGMPLAAIATNMVDFVLSTEQIAAKLIALRKVARHIQLVDADDAPDEALREGEKTGEVATSEEALQRVITMLCADTGHDFRHYKRATVLRRIERRLLVKGVTSLRDYADLLEREPLEFKALLKDLLIGVTNFFRDRDAFDALEHSVVPELFRNKAQGEQVRVWVAACGNAGQTGRCPAVCFRYRR
ncbi:chemotaxis protein CheB [Duganella sp. OV458]|uniref:chemotaxis protein CheB n=1 Tax=Duganella sp. OV458 TaxID=1855290 RepID=UPI001E3CEC23|nr:chemotaxis protein CheB [Duganella sp. OV458]